MKSILVSLSALLMLSGAAVAADIPIKAASPGVGQASVPASFAGLWFGGTIGYGQTTGDPSVNGFHGTNNKPCYWKCGGEYEVYKKGWGGGKDKYSPLTAGNFPSTIAGDADGLTIGGAIGYRWQFGNMVIGPLVDWEWSNIKGSQNFAIAGANTQYNTRVRNIGTIVAQGGMAFGPTLIYGTGGFAWGKVEHSATSFGPGCGVAGVVCPSGSDSSTKTGWTAGGGIEHQWGSGWAIKTDYRYLSLGSSAMPVTLSDGLNNYSAVVNRDNRIHEIRVGFTKKVNLF